MNNQVNIVTMSEPIVAIKGMKMPRDCSCCPCCYPLDVETKTLETGNFFCSASDGAYDITTNIFREMIRPSFCPLIEVLNKLEES